MNDKNFDSLKNLKAPEKWIENALNIPDTVAKKPAVIPFRIHRTLAYVACFVLVCVLSFTLFITTHDNATPPVDRNFPTEENAKDESLEIENDSKDSKEEEKKNFFEKVFDELFDTDKKEKTSNGLSSVVEQVENETKPKPTIKPESTSPSDKEEAIKPSTNTPSSTEPSEKPTEKPTEKPSDDDEQEIPTDGAPDTEIPTTKPPQKPTVPDDKPEPSVPQTPGDNTPGNPGESSGPGTNQTFVTFTIIVDDYYIDAGETVLCAVYDPNGIEVCSYQNASLYRSGGYTFATFSTYINSGAVSGNYTCHFINSYYHSLGVDTQYVSN
ncbi:MAG: hypothetical protein IKB73_06485 [Ruminococcus sp.]|nr:hypothetical protein [Ruminococcus sp.]